MAEAVTGHLLRHATCIALDGQGLLIEGPAGAGKSSLALRLMALGAALVADDQVLLRRSTTGLSAEAPAGLPRAIEARGLGLLRADLAGPAPLHLVVDLAQAEPERLPPRRLITLLGCAIPLVLGRDTPHLAAGLMQYLCKGRFA